ncbi:hypothetical protein E0Z10_g9419 [Xylaria hypoxylon]|uniref:ZZ-type domain-containing protein n=1 Tax=Xylaria hypoxylon TaxID=37992 RepID=A0A4Z0YJ56_9PEZI|nr:hypothetical protein E0Z10_g9419 [Xylaria hypoxylon]
MYGPTHTGFPYFSSYSFLKAILEQMNGLDDDDSTNDTMELSILFKTLEEYISRKEQGEYEGDADEGPTEENERSQHSTDVDDLANETGTQAIKTPDSKVGVEGNEVFGPEEKFSRRPRSRADGGEGDESSKADPREGKLALQLDSNAWAYSCDGCGYDAEDKGNMWFCEICYDIAFCSECLEKARP